MIVTAILDAILEMTPLLMSDSGRLLVCIYKLAFISYWNGACVLACDFIVTLHQVCFGISFDCSCCNMCATLCDLY